MSQGSPLGTPRLSIFQNPSVGCCPPPVLHKADYRKAVKCLTAFASPDNSFLCKPPGFGCAVGSPFACRLRSGPSLPSAARAPGRAARSRAGPGPASYRRAATRERIAPVGSPRGRVALVRSESGRSRVLAGPPIPPPPIDSSAPGQSTPVMSSTAAPTTAPGFRAEWRGPAEPGRLSIQGSRVALCRRAVPAGWAASVPPCAACVR